MSIFNELLPKITEISNSFTKSFNDDLKAIFESFDKFEDDYHNGRGKARDKNQRDKNPITTLQSINEDDDESTKATSNNKRTSSRKSNEKVSKQNSTEETSKVNDLNTDDSSDKPRGASKKRSKDEVEGMSSPEQEKRQKRNASVKAQSFISKQNGNNKEVVDLNNSCVVVLTPLVNVSAKLKLRREADPNEKKRGRRPNNEEDKENAEPTMIVEIKQEKVSMPPEPMDMESLSLNMEVKQEPEKDEVAMPPPMAPVPKPRKNAAKEKEKADESSEEETSGRRRTTRTKKQTDTMPPPPPPAPTAASRSTRASSRASARKQVEEEPAVQAIPEGRPKRTRTKKKVSEPSTTEVSNDVSQNQTVPVSPPEKPRPKRTRRGQKAAEKPVEASAAKDPEAAPKSPVLVKEEKLSKSDDFNSPILTQKSKLNSKANVTRTIIQSEVDSTATNETEVEKRMNATQVLSTGGADRTRVLSNGVYNHDPATPKNKNMNETVVLETRDRETIVVEKPAVVMDATVVIEKDPNEQNVTDDNSVLTDDNSLHEARTPPKPDMPMAQPTSAVKEKVQQFEELASRVTRTKTRAMAKRQDESTENQTPPDKISKAILDPDTLKKMNSLIFNGKPPQISSSASKPKANVPAKTLPSSTSKLSGLSRHKELADEAKRKKDALLEAKRELHRKKREEKMAAAAAARLAAERERQLQAAALEKERTEKLAQLSNHRVNKMKELERKKQELARKVAETEERRKAEELLRQQRLAEEQKRLDENRKKQMMEHEATKKEAAIMAKEIEKRQKEYIEKQKKRLEEHKHYTPLKNPGTPSYHMEPVYLQDGFQYLNSDEEDDDSKFPVPAWSSSKARKPQLQTQYHISQQHIDLLFSVRVHTPDLREIFPNIERSRLKRTSSAVWRTPPSCRMPVVSE